MKMIIEMDQEVQLNELQINELRMKNHFIKQSMIKRVIEMDCINYLNLNISMIRKDFARSQRDKRAKVNS